LKSKNKEIIEYQYEEKIRKIEEYEKKRLEKKYKNSKSNNKN